MSQQRQVKGSENLSSSYPLEKEQLDDVLSELKRVSNIDDLENYGFPSVRFIDATGNRGPSYEIKRFIIEPINDKIRQKASPKRDISGPNPTKLGFYGQFAFATVHAGIVDARIYPDGEGDIFDLLMGDVDNDPTAECKTTSNIENWAYGKDIELTQLQNSDYLLLAKTASPEAYVDLVGWQHTDVLLPENPKNSTIKVKLEDLIPYPAISEHYRSRLYTPDEVWQAVDRALTGEK